MKVESKISLSILISFIIFIIIVLTTITYFSNKTSESLFSEISKFNYNLYISHRKSEIKRNVSEILGEIEYRRNNLNKNIKKMIKHDVYKGYNVAFTLYNRFHDVLDKKELQNLILNTLAAISKTYKDKSKYLFVVNTKGIILLHPKIKKGTNVYNYKDAVGKYFVKEYINLAKKEGEGFVNYYWYKPDSFKMYKKLTFVKLFKPFNWIIALGYYYDDMEKIIQKDILNFIERLNTNKKGEYYFVLKIVSPNTIKVLLNPNFENFNKNINVIILKDKNGHKFIKEMVRKCIANSEGYVKYYYREPESKKEELKISYVRLYMPWNWIIGTGFYVKSVMKEFDKDKLKIARIIKKNQLILILYIISFSALFLVLGIFLTIFVRNRIKYYRKQLENKELFQKRLINSIPIPLFVKDIEGNYLDVNKEFEKFFGVDRDKIFHREKSNGIDTELDILDRIIEADIYLFKKYKSEEYIKKSEIDFITSNGELKRVLIVKSFYKNLNGEVSGIIGVIIDFTKQKELEEKLMEMSIRDELTRLYNRRYFNEVIKLEVERAKRYKHPLSIIYFDIDHFKKINDTYGHNVGDIVLKELSELVSHKIRKVDFLFRIGGEEFVLLLINTPLENACNVAEKIRVAVEEKEFPVVKRITISLGVTEFRKEDTIESFINRADKALYTAKNSGRNKVIVL